MIIKLTKAGGIARYLDAKDVLVQPVEGNRIDLEIVMDSGPNPRFLITNEDVSAVEDPKFPHAKDTMWNRAYIMERGKTVDTIRA